MKRILPLLMAALLLPALSLGAAAAGQAEIVRAFGAGETLYTYVDLGEGASPSPGRRPPWTAAPSRPPAAWRPCARPAPLCPIC